MVNIRNILDKFGDVLNVIFIANSMAATILLSIILYLGKPRDLGPINSRKTEIGNEKTEIDTINYLDIIYLEIDLLKVPLTYFYISILIMMATGFAFLLGISYQAYQFNSKLKWLYAFTALIITVVYITPLWVLMGKLTNGRQAGTDSNLYIIEMSLVEYEWLKVNIIINVILLVLIGLFWTITEWFGQNVDVIKEMKEYCNLIRKSEESDITDNEKASLDKLNRTYGAIKAKD
jgi:hypothetical protein